MSHQILMHYFGSDLLEHPITLETAVVYSLGLWWPCYQFWNHVGECKLLKCETFKLLCVYMNDRNNFRKTKKEHSLPLFAFILLELIFIFIFCKLSLLNHVLCHLFGKVEKINMLSVCFKLLNEG